MSKIKKVLPTVALVLAAALVFLYALEYYDFTFIKRPEEEAGSDVPETEAVTTPENTAPPATEPPATEPPEAEPEPVIDPRTFPDADAAGKDGYFLTSMPYSADSMILAELRSRLETTNDFTLRTRTWNKPTYEYEMQNGEAELAWTPTEENIPALEAYMGYIFADTGETVNVYDSYGRFLNTYNPNLFEFAYKRDAAGNPLFRQTYYYTAATKDGTQSATFKGFNYFYMSENGGIYNTAYNDAVNGRGVMADYPAYFGVSDNGLGRKCVYNDVVQKTVKNKLKSFVRTRWNITWGGVPINDTVYYAAYPYSEGYACVTDEEGTMYFVNTSGNKTFETKKEYWSEGRYVVDRLLLALDETTALGCYYFDHGLVKARRQIYDYYQLDTFDIMYVMSDEYVMLYKDGSEFPIPTNYKVLTYSDGVILLEKNGTYGYMDYTGAWLNSPDYEDAEHFSEGLAPCKKDGKWGMIDTAGKTVLPFIYDYIQPTSSGVIIAHSEYGWNVYLKMSK